MFPNSTLLNPLFWIGMGMVFSLVMMSAKIWAEDFGIDMSWWKWIIVAGWGSALLITIAGGFTLLGENEIKAGFYFLGFFGVITIVAGVGIWRFILTRNYR